MGSNTGLGPEENPAALLDVMGRPPSPLAVPSRSAEPRRYPPAPRP